MARFDNIDHGDSSTLPEIRRSRRMQSNTILRDVTSTEKLMGNNNNLNNNGSPGADIMFQMEDDSLTQLGSVFQSAYQSIVGGSAQVRQKLINVLFFFSCSFSLSLSLSVLFIYLVRQDTISFRRFCSLRTLTFLVS